MTFLRDKPLRKKLFSISLLSSGMALIITIAALFVYDWNTRRPRIVRNLESIADLYNVTLPASISFNDAKAANENLNTMKAQTEISLACIYRPDGKIFAKYVRQSEIPTVCPAKFSKKSEIVFKGSDLQIFRKINYGNELLGHLYIQYNMPTILTRIMQYGTIVVAVLLSLIFTSVLFIAGFEKKIIRPILKLETVAREISAKKNYKLRAKKMSEDEIGILTDEFNHMLNTLDGSIEALYKSESRFRRVSESNMIGIIFVNIYGEILEANDYFLKMIGYTREDLNNHKINWSELTPDEYKHLNEKALEELKELNVFHSFEKDYFRKDGSRVSVLIGGAFLEGSKTEMVDFVLDISKRKKTEIENARLLVDEHKARTMAEEALQIREDFMSIAAHELRTPLTPLKLQLGYIKRELTKNSESPKVKMLLKLMQSSDEQINQLSRLIDDILDVSHIRTGRFTLNLESVDVTELVKSVIERYQFELNKLKIDLTVIIKSEIRGFWDRLRIEQVLINLLTNAMKYGEKKSIQITVEANDQNAYIIVQDHGIGITKKDQMRIFNRFERAVSVKNFGGLGLGLYITRQIIEAHMGHITVESQPGMGSSFIVELPLGWPLAMLPKTQNPAQSVTTC